MDRLSTATASKSKVDFLNEVNRLLTEDLENDLDDLDDFEDLDDELKGPNNGAGTSKPPDRDENYVPAVKRKRVAGVINKDKVTKEINKIQREVNAAKNTKCELYLYAHCSNSLLNLDGKLDSHVKRVFKERKIEGQFIFEEMEFAKVYWEKKKISAELVDNTTVVRKENFERQFGFLVGVDGGSFKLMVDSKQCDEFISNALADHHIEFEGEARMTIAVVGEHNISQAKIMSLGLSLFDKYKVQLRFCRNIEDFTYLIAQMHRTLAKMEKKLETFGIQLHVNVEKGIKEGDNLVEDWWGRMLDHMHRLPEECRRAIIEVYPNPFVLMEKLDEMTPGDAMQEFAGIECSNGRRVGPAVAQKLYFMMTSEDGTEIIDRPTS